MDPKTTIVPFLANKALKLKVDLDLAGRFRISMPIANKTMDDLGLSPLVATPIWWFPKIVLNHQF